MNIKDILELNEKYNIYKTETELKLKEESLKIEKLNKQLSIEEFTSLSYKEAKDVYTKLYYNLDYQNQRKQLEKLLQELKEKEYPILLKAHYYPIINEIDFLTDSQKNKLDTALFKFKNSYIMTESTIWYSVFDINLSDKVLEFLYSNKIVSKTYSLSCTCGSDECTPDVITEEQYNKFIAYHSITEDEVNKMTDEEHEDYDKKWSKEGYFEVGCWNDGGYEICSIDDLKEHAELYKYFNNTKPDMTYENL